MVTKAKVDGSAGHSVALQGMGLGPPTPHSTQELHRECTAQNKWERTNPGTACCDQVRLLSNHRTHSPALSSSGIILAHCIGKVFGVNFTASTTSEVHLLARQHGAAVAPSTQLGRNVQAERFNVYGVLRTLLGDFDAWYVDAKRSAEAIKAISGGQKRAVDGTEGSLAVLARDVVSFHYVNEVEARLLYELLSGEAVAWSSADAKEVRHLPPTCHARAPHTLTKPVSTTADCSTAREIHAQWPATDKAAGHYSRPLSKGPTSFHEAELLYEYFLSVVIG